MTRIAVIMTVHNRKATTLNSLKNLFAAQLPNDCELTVYLTDDGSTDGTSDAIAEAYPQVKIIQGDGNLFWNRGMHKAWETAAEGDYDYYLWLNDDTFVYNDFICELLKAAETTENSACISGPVENDKKNSMTYGGMRKMRTPVRPNGTVQEIDYFQGNIVLVPRRVFQQVGNLDYTYRHSRGDSDYGLTAGRMGIKSYETPGYLGICNWHESAMKCFNPKVSLRQRWKALYQPTGENPKEVFYYWRKHSNVFVAAYYVLNVMTRATIPQLWFWMGKETINGQTNKTYTKK